jgi:hypothetical protein
MGNADLAIYSWLVGNPSVMPRAKSMKLVNSRILFAMSALSSSR